MKRFVLIYLISFILCLSSLASGEEMKAADGAGLSGSDGSAASVSAGVLTNDGLVSLAGGMTTNSAIAIPSDMVMPDSLTKGSAITAIGDVTTKGGGIFIPEGDIPGGANIISTSAAITTSKDTIMTTSAGILPAESLMDNLSAVTAAAAGGYMSLTVTPASYDMGVVNSGTAYTYTGAVTLDVSTKSGWSLSVSATNFSNGTYSIPAGRLKCKVSTDSTYKTLTSAPVDLLTNQSKAWPQSRTIQVDYQITVLSTDPAGTNFRNNITFTLY